MRRVIAMGCVCAMALLLAAAGASAGQGGDDRSSRLAAKQCTAEQKADRAAFRATYGENAMRNCIRAHRPVIEDELRNAAKQCRAQQQSDPATFEQTYGEGSNAYGKCVSRTVRQEINGDVEAFRNAAQECRAEREADPALFQETFGTNESQGKGSKRNAFGKCVSTKVQESESAGGTT